MEVGLLQLAVTHLLATKAGAWALRAVYGGHQRQSQTQTQHKCQKRGATKSSKKSFKRTQTGRQPPAAHGSANGQRRQGSHRSRLHDPSPSSAAASRAKATTVSGGTHHASPAHAALLAAAPLGFLPWGAHNQQQSPQPHQQQQHQHLLLTSSCQQQPEGKPRQHQIPHTSDSSSSESICSSAAGEDNCNSAAATRTALLRSSWPTSQAGSQLQAGPVGPEVLGWHLEADSESLDVEAVRWGDQPLEQHAAQQRPQGGSKGPLWATAVAAAARRLMRAEGGRMRPLTGTQSSAAPPTATPGGAATATATATATTPATSGGSTGQPPSHPHPHHSHPQHVPHLVGPDAVGYSGGILGFDLGSTGGGFGGGVGGFGFSVRSGGGGGGFDATGFRSSMGHIPSSLHSRRVGGGGGGGRGGLWGVRRAVGDVFGGVAEWAVEGPVRSLREFNRALTESVSGFLASDSGRRLSEQVAAEMSGGALMAPVYLTEELVKARLRSLVAAHARRVAAFFAVRVMVASALLHGAKGLVRRLLRKRPPRRLPTWLLGSLDWCLEALLPTGFFGPLLGLTAGVMQMAGVGPLGVGAAYLRLASSAAVAEAPPVQPPLATALPAVAAAATDAMAAAAGGAVAAASETVATAASALTGGSNSRMLQ
ncbi:hypothetical protein Agub_g8454 [Astrephomene gubernaculifera]|uniref:Uncharacterized protein n=1 Tax=Astrephomene gubernaculifera TaxID=47775 RepID=A0AAD3DTL0_9CHLO|nr:hypothetical protein Agub_g8454 [Astrephomene gubernaculifera]